MSTLLDVNDISISFGGIKAVQHVSFKIEEGEILGLIGPNGSGKSTCVNLITGVYPLDTGSITFGGQMLTARHSIAVRAKMGMGRTFQTPRPFENLNVYDSIYAIALQKHNFANAAKRTEEILKMTELAPLAHMNSGKLSIEKRKWLDLARILAIDPKFIMLDEVMAGLTPIEMNSSLELIRRINQEGKTVLFIEHVMRAVVNICSRVVVLNEGTLLCDGAPNEVLKRQDVVEAYLGGGYKHE